MADYALSTDSAVQTQFDRLSWLSPGRDVLGLERISALLERLGNPHHQLPPVIHVAGTNGKGSTCAFLRAILEAAGHRVHVYTSPHLIRFNERIRIKGRLIEDAQLASLLAQVLDKSSTINPSFFEATTAAAFLAFAHHQADVCIIEVGLGGRLDATNVIARPLVTAIAGLGIDHCEFLLSPEKGIPHAPLERIAYEKAAIAKRCVPLVTMCYSAGVQRIIARLAEQRGAVLIAQGALWDATIAADSIAYRDSFGSLSLPRSALIGAHQSENAALATAILRHQSRLEINAESIVDGIRTAHWPARMQRLSPGPLTALAAEHEIWLDGGHNVAAAQRIAAHFKDSQAQNDSQAQGGKIDIIAGLLANKDAVGFLNALAPIAGSLIALPIAGHAHHSPESLVGLAHQAGFKHAEQAPDIRVALARLAASAPPPGKFSTPPLSPGTQAGAQENQGKPPGKLPARAAILGSLYLAGQILRANGETLA